MVLNKSSMINTCLPTRYHFLKSLMANRACLRQGVDTLMLCSLVSNDRRRLAMCVRVFLSFKDRAACSCGFRNLFLITINRCGLLAWVCIRLCYTVSLWIQETTHLIICMHTSLPYIYNTSYLTCSFSLIPNSCVGQDDLPTDVYIKLVVLGEA